MIIILGAGLSGLSCSFHIGHAHCMLLQKNGHAFGHIHSEIREGFTWDQGQTACLIHQARLRPVTVRQKRGRGLRRA
jgi:hypothetical protein